ncbi:DNA internalization-related competence protein ComEC/Rec2 [Chloroflexota bacterium]
MSLIYLSCAWLAGIFLGTEFDLPVILIFAGLIPLPLFFLVRQHRKIILLTSFGFFALFTASVYSHSSLHTINESSLRFYNDNGVTEIRGMVARDPDVRDKSTHLYIESKEIKLDGGWQKIKGTALVFMPRYPTYEYGDVLHITGKLETPAQFNDFDYKDYLASQGIYTTVLYPKIEIEAVGEGFQPRQWIYSVREQVAQTFSRVLPEPQASLAQGIILGIRGNIPQTTKTDFIHTGTAHLLAISGLHLSIIVGILLSIGIWIFGRRHYFHIWLALGAIWLYALLTGLPPSVLRGAIMASLFLIAELLGRQGSAITALTFAAAVMVGISPYILGNAAFQLSFLAMAGLVFLFPAFRSLGRRAVRATLGEDGAPASIAGITCDSLSATLSAVIFVWPVVAYYFGIISFVGPLATFLTLPALPGIIIAGALTGGLGFIALPIAQTTGWLTWLFLSYMLLVVNGLAKSSLSFIETGSVDPTLILAYYLILATVIFFSRKKSFNLMPRVATQMKSGTTKSFNFISKLSKKWVVLPLLLAAILVSFTAATMPDDNLHVSFLNVGQGDAIFIQEGSQQILVDGGPSPQTINMELGKKMAFWDRTIDLVVLTHPNYDHLAGLVEVLHRFKVKQVLYPDSDEESPLYDEWLKLIKEKRIKYTIARAGQQIDLGEGTLIKVLNPQIPNITGTESDIDNNGAVLRLSKNNVSFLLAADIRRKAEFHLITDRVGLKSTVLKIAHHGSDTSTTPEFLSVVNPQVAIICVGADNQFGHPKDEVLARLQAKLDPENIYRTDRHGTVEFITNGERLWVK